MVFNKREHIKEINECNQELKKVFKDTFLINNGWVVGVNEVEIGIHFSKINDPDSGLYRFTPSDKIITYNTNKLFATIDRVKKKKNNIDLFDIILKDNGLVFDTSVGNIEIGSLVTELNKTEKDTVEVIYNTINKLDKGITLDDDMVYNIYKNKHFVTVPTPIEDVRVSKELIPTIKYTSKQVSDVTVFTLPSENEFMFKVVFKVVNDYVTHYHMYMVIKKDRC